jgi:hypothetical protein
MIDQQRGEMGELKSRTAATDSAVAYQNHWLGNLSLGICMRFRL